MEETDPLGFTKQTAMILEGLEAQDLIPEFKKRDISTDALEKLSKEDLIVLGASEEFAEQLIKQLKIRAKKLDFEIYNGPEKIDQLLNILKYGNQQLYLIETFLAYSRQKLMKAPNDFIINRNNSERASQALVSAINCSIYDLRHLERNYQKLSSLIYERNLSVKNSKIMANSLIAGFGMFTCLIFTWKLVAVLTRH